jgi:hypothetical protein
VDAAQRRGYLTCDPQIVFDPEFDFDDEGNPAGAHKAYAWMRDRMAERMPEFSGDFPMFCWLKRPSGKPLPNSFGQMVRVTALVPRHRLLASWHDGFLTVAHDWAGTFQAFGEERGEDQSREAVEASYGRILDVGDPAFWRKGKVHGGDRIQVCADRIHVREIVGCRPVPIRPPPRRFRLMT